MAAADIITSSTGTVYNNVLSQTTQRNTDAMGKDDFLNLLVTQLKYQDPMNPVDDKEFLAQMAQFSALEQMQNLNNTFGSVKAFGLIGKYVVAQTFDEENNEIKTTSGQVDSIKIDRGQTYVIVKGTEIPIDDVDEVYDSITSIGGGNLSEYSGLLGMKVKGCVYDPNTGAIITVDGTVEALEKGKYEDYASINGVSAEIISLHDYNLEKGVAEQEPEDADFVRKKAYVDDYIGKEIEAVMYDRVNDVKVPVKGILTEVTYEGNRVKVKLDKVLIPVDSVYGLTK